MLSFDITDRHVRIIRGTEANNKIKVAAASTIDLEEGLIVNGHIKDIPKMATIINDELKARRMADKEAVISISSNLVIFKELHIPKAKGSQLLSMVQNQMQHTMGIADDYSISYTIAGEIEEDGVQAMKVLATACPFEVVDCFRKVFSMLGIGLRSVAVACNTITRIILSDPKMRAKMPMLLVQIDPNFVSLNLYENNQLTFSRFASIDPVDYDNSPDYIYEAVNENIFRMFQFQKSRNGDNPIQNVVFYGDTSENYIRLTNALEQMDITTSLLGIPNNIGGYENFEFQAYANAIGAMFRSNKDSERINLLEVDAAVGRSGAGASFAISVGVAALASVAIVAGVTLWGHLTKVQYETEIAEKQALIDSPETAQRIAAVDAMQAKIDKVLAFKDGVETAKYIYDTQPVLTSEVIDTINENFEKIADIKTYVYGQGAFTVNCTADNNDAPAKVVANFIEQDIFDNVTYTGYSGSDTEDGKDEFSFTISFDMRKVTPEIEEADTAEGVE